LWQVVLNRTRGWMKVKALVSMGLKALVSAVLAAVAVAMVMAIVKIWSPSKLSVGQFIFRRDDAEVSEAGKAFTLSLVMRLKQIYRTLSDDDGGSMLLASTDQLGRGAPIELPIAKSDVEGVEVEAYGIKVSSLISMLQKSINTPNEITGTVTQTKESVDIFAEMKSPMLREESTYWQITEPTLDAASYALAVHVLLLLLEQKEQGFQGVSGPDFVTFTRALESYKRYRRALQSTTPGSDPKKFLATADELVGGLVQRATALPYAYKLAGYVLRERSKTSEARAAFEKYLDILKTRNLQDKKAAEALEALQPKADATAATAVIPVVSGKLTIKPGLSIGIGGNSHTAGTLGLVVQDGQGVKSLLTAASLLQGRIGDEIFQPSPVDGEGAPIATVSSFEPHEALGIARLKAGVAWTSKVATLNEIKGVLAPSAITIGQDVSFVGRTSGLKRARVVGLAVSMRIYTGGDKPELFDDLIMLSPSSKAGDAGALVFTDDGLAIGIVFAGSDTNAIAAPLAGFMKKHELTIAPESQ